MVDQTRDPRMAGDIVRYHTWRTHQRQSVASHSWQILRILLAVWPDVRRDVLVYVTFHDVGEIATGDLPFPIKKNNARLKDEIVYEEGMALLAMGEWGVPGLPTLSPFETLLIKACEYIEMWEFALVEVEMGNMQCTLVRNRCIEAYEETMRGLRRIASEDTRCSKIADYISMRESHHRQVLGGNSEQY